MNIYHIILSHYSKSNGFGDDMEYCEEDDNPTQIDVWVGKFSEEEGILNSLEEFTFRIDDEGLACAKIQELHRKYEGSKIEHY